MKKIITCVTYLVLISFTSNGQILNGGFEQWSSSEPVSWQTNNINEPNLTLTPITQSSFAHGGSFALKGEVLEVPVDGPTITHAPILVSGTLEDPVFSYSGKPEYIRGFYNFQSVGGDGFVANAFLLSGENPIAVSGFTTNNSTGPGYHELIMDFFYVDTVTTPDAIQIFFQISPAPGETFANVGSTFYIDDLSKITLIKPQEALQENGGEQPVFISGEVDTIKWNSGGALNIDIKYSTDNGSTFQNIVSNYPGDSSRYFWAVPGSLLTRDAQIKIVESQNSNNEVESINFTLKPWQFTRILNDELDLFRPNKDGWSFSNSSPNDVWPQTWWQQFDYQLGTDSITGLLYPFAQPFQSAMSSDHPDWPIFVNVFGIARCYNNSPPTLYNSSATTKWAGIKGNWGGSCFGFAISSLIGFYYTGSLVNQFPGIGNFGALFNVPLSNDARRAINHYYTTQFGQEDTQHTSNHIGDTPQQLLAQLKEMFRKENGDGKALSFYNNNGSGGHTVVPYKLERVGTTSTFNLRLYDSNAPGSINNIIFIDSTANTWTDSTGLNWGTGSSRCFLEPASFSFLLPQTLRPIEPPLTTEKANNNGVSRVTIYNTSAAEIVITSNIGNQIGYQDSIAFNNISEAIPLIPKTGSFHAPIGYYLPASPYSLQINNFTDSISYVLFLTDSTIYNYRRSDAVNNEIDLLEFSDNGIGITNPDQVIKHADLETIIIQDTVVEKVFVTNNIQISASDSIHIREIDRNELLFQNYGNSMSYDLQIRYASASGGTNFLHMSIQMAQNSAHQIVPEWTNLNSEPITILIDLGNDGTIDDTIFVKNQATNVEDEGTLISPDNYNLAQNFPNPFNPTTSIRYSIPKRSNVTLKVYDILGNEVASLVDEEKDRGVYTVTFNATGLSSGIYFYSLRADGFVQTKKMLLLK